MLKRLMDTYDAGKVIREGATTVMEAWALDQKANCSMCHPWASAPLTILIEDILEIHPDGSRGNPHLPEGIEADVFLKPLL